MPVCPETVGRGKPPSSSSANSASGVPSASAAGAKPDPSTMATSCSARPVSSASFAALARAAAYGSSVNADPQGAPIGWPSRLDVRLAVGGGGAHLADQAGHGHDRGHVGQHPEQIGGD